LALCATVLVSSCSFPQHDFVPDSTFSSEVCGNNVDDDGDGFTDCQDSECACLPGVPEGWAGPEAIWTGSFTEAVPSCSGAYRMVAQSLGFDLKVPALTCDTCSCGPVQDAECKALIQYRSGGCSAGYCWTDGSSPCGVMLQQGCNDIQLAVDASTSTVRPQLMLVPSNSLKVVGGSCSPEGAAQPAPDPATFGERVLSCGGLDSVSSGAACTQGLCVPRPAEGFQSELCIRRDGDVECPSAWGTRRVAWRSIHDDRACSECACGDPAGMSCGSVEIWDYPDDLDCTGANQQSPLQCVSAAAPDSGAIEHRHVSFSATVEGGSCDATGGEVTGAAAGADPVTFCCTTL